MLRLARFENGIVAVVAIWLGAFVGYGQIPPEISSLLFFSAATFLILSAGNGINDIFDEKIDAVNQPERPLPSGRLSRSAAWTFSSCAMAGGVACSFVAGPVPALIAVFSGISLIIYAIKLKAVPMAGNILVGALTGLTFVSGGIISGRPQAAAVPAVFAFFFTFSREIFKDIQDVKGDREVGIKTIPVVWGTEKAWKIALIPTAAGILYSPFPFFFNGYSLIYLGIILVAVDAVLVTSLARLGREPGPENAGRMQKILKYDIIAGFAAIFLGRF